MTIWNKEKYLGGEKDVLLLYYSSTHFNRVVWKNKKRNKCLNNKCIKFARKKSWKNSLWCQPQWRMNLYWIQLHHAHSDLRCFSLYPRELWVTVLEKYALIGSQKIFIKFPFLFPSHWYKDFYLSGH